MKFIEGRFYSSGEKNLYVKHLGNGSPTVVFEPDWGGLSVEWQAIQNEIGKITSCITYDRAGYAESPINKIRRTAPQIAGELYSVLQNSLTEPPYIIVGHGAGGFYAQQFALMFPRFIAGLVLVDSMTCDDSEFSALETPFYQDNISNEARMNTLKHYTEMEKEEFEQVVMPVVQRVYSDFPPELKHFLMTYTSDQNFYKTITDEYDAFEESAKIFKQAKGNFPKIPVKVLCHDWQVMAELAMQLGCPESEARAVEELWIKHSSGLLGLSDLSELLLVKGSSHNIHYSNPEIIIESIVKMIEEFRGGEKIEFFY